MDDFGWLNWSIIGLYIAFALFMGFYLSKRVKTAEHYYLGNRTTPWWAIGMSVVATYIGALTFLGGPFWAYQDGISVILIHVNYPIAVFVVVTVPPVGRHYANRMLRSLRAGGLRARVRAHERFLVQPIPGPVRDRQVLQGRRGIGPHVPRVQ